jgi:hypothetical protein
MDHVRRQAAIDVEPLQALKRGFEGSGQLSSESVVHRLVVSHTYHAQDDRVANSAKGVFHGRVDQLDCF